MAKHEGNAIIYLLCVVIGILFVLLSHVLLRLMTTDAALKYSTQENRKVTITMIDERERFERLLKAVQSTEKGEE